MSNQEPIKIRIDRQRQLDIPIRLRNPSGWTSWGNIDGNIESQQDLVAKLNAKQDVISDIDTIREKSSTALQSGDNVSELTNDAGYVDNTYHDDTKQDVIDDIDDIRETTNSNAEALQTKQDTLISGTNIKTVNNQSLLGSGNITIQGGGDGTWGSITGNISDQEDLYTLFYDIYQQLNNFVITPLDDNYTPSIDESGVIQFTTPPTLREELRGL